MSTAPAHISKRMTDWFRAIFGPDQVVELRTLRPNGSFFRCARDEADVEVLVNKARRETRNARGVYFTLNPLAESKVKDVHGPAARDEDVIARRFLLLDFD